MTTSKTRFDPLVLARYGIISPVQVNSRVFPRLEMSKEEFAEADRHYLQGFACVATGVYTPIGKAYRVLRASGVPLPLRRARRPWRF